MFAGKKIMSSFKNIVLVFEIGKSLNRICMQYLTGRGLKGGWQVRSWDLQFIHVEVETKV